MDQRYWFDALTKICIADNLSMLPSKIGVGDMVDGDVDVDLELRRILKPSFENNREMLSMKM